jgi:N-methylhydantoinase A
VVALPDAAGGLERFLQDFAAAHRREYGYALEGRTVEIVNCRLQAVGNVPRAPVAHHAGGGAAEAAAAGRRPVYFGAVHGWLETPVYLRSDLAAGTALRGPAVIEEMSATVVLPPAMRAEIDRFGNIVVHVQERG